MDLFYCSVGCMIKWVEIATLYSMHMTLWRVVRWDKEVKFSFFLSCLHIL